MERTTRTQLHNFLLPFMGDEGERHALIENAFFGTPVINQIDWRGDAETFTTTLITRLLRYGVVADDRPALVVLLANLRDRVGTDRQAEIDTLIEVIQAAPAEQPQPESQPTPSRAPVIERLQETRPISGRLNVFVSSTSRDLEPYREAVTLTALRLGMYPIVMEAFNPTADNALQLCYDKVQEADVFIGIYAHRYGYAPGPDVTYILPDGSTRQGDGQTGITELEYQWARERGIPTLLFVVSDTDAEGDPLAWPVAHIEDEPGKSRLRAFKNTVMGRHVVGFFHSPDHLAMQVATGLLDVIQQQAASTPSQPRRDYYQHIKLPKNYVPREELREALTGKLVGGNPIVALRGIGGIGKSVMARSLCEEPTVQAVYPSGILWATLGQTPNLQAELTRWIRHLGGTISETAPSLETLKQAFQEAVRDREYLLIVDDVWEQEHIETFIVDAPRCTVLFTTRSREIAEAVGADLQNIPPMTFPEAIRLLEEWAEGRLAYTPDEQKAEIVRRVGRLALTVRIAGAQLKRREPDEWLDEFSLDRLTTRGTKREHGSLEEIFQQSLDELEEEDDAYLYTALAIFKEDELIPEVAIHKLWGALAELEEYETADLIEDLAGNGLLEVEGEGYDLRVRIHDLLREFIGNRLTEEQAQEAHRALIDAYRETQSGDGWHTAPDDGYLYAHLVYHLDAMGNIDAIRALFANHDWMHARVPADDWRYDGYLRDLDVYWQDAERRSYEQIEAGKAPDAFAEVVHCSLIRTSINTIASSYTPRMLERAVQLNLWSVGRAITTIRNVATDKPLNYIYSGWTRRLEMYVHLLEGISADHTEYQQILTEVHECYTEAEQEYKLNSGAPVVAKYFNYLDKDKRISELSELLSKVTFLEEWDIYGRRSPKIEFTKAFADHFSRDQLDIVLEVCKSLDDERYCPNILKTISHRLSDDQAKKAIQIAESLNDETNQILAKASVLEHLSQVLIQQLYRDALQMENEKGTVLIALIPYLSPEQRNTISQDITSYSSVFSWAAPEVWYLSEIAPYLNDYTINSVVSTITKSLSGQMYHSAGLIALARLFPYIPQNERRETIDLLLSELQSRGYHSGLVRLLTMITNSISLLDGKDRAYLVSELFQYVRKYDVGYWEILPYLSVQQVSLILSEQLNLSGNYNTRVMLNLGKYIEDSLVNRTIIGFAESGNDRVAKLVADFAKRIPVNRIGELAESVEQASSRYEKIRSLTNIALIDVLPTEIRSKIFLKFIDELQDTENSYWRQINRSLIKIAPLLDASMQLRCVEALFSDENGFVGVVLLRTLAPHLNEKTLRIAFKLAVDTAEQFNARFSVTLSLLLPYLSPEYIDQAIAIADGLEDEYWRSFALYRISISAKQHKYIVSNIPNYDFDQLQSVSIEDIFKMVREGITAFDLPDLIVYCSVLNTESQREVFGMFEEIEYYRKHIMIEAIVPYLHKELLNDLIDVIGSIDNSRDRYDALGALLPHLPENLFQPFLDLVESMAREEYISRAIVDMVSYLYPKKSGKLKEATNKLENAMYRAQIYHAISEKSEETSHDLLFEIRRATLTHLRNVQGLRRSEVANLCSSSILSSPTQTLHCLSQIGDIFVDIYDNWRWV